MVIGLEFDQPTDRVSLRAAPLSIDNTITTLRRSQDDSPNSVISNPSFKF